MSTTLFGAVLTNYWPIVVVTIGNVRTCKRTYVKLLSYGKKLWCWLSLWEKLWCWLQSCLENVRTYKHTYLRTCTPFLRKRLWDWVVVYAVTVITVYAIYIVYQDYHDIN